jgi:superfamily II DNA/RNA helicase
MLEHNRKSTLIFAANRKHAKSIYDVFRGNSIAAECITGDTPKEERVRLIEAFKRREFPVLINCEILTEGTNIPVIDCVLLARPVYSIPLQIQMIGRGLRRLPETSQMASKVDCLILEIHDRIWRDGKLLTWSSMQLDPTLQGLEVVPRNYVDSKSALLQSKLRNALESVNEVVFETKKKREPAKSKETIDDSTRMRFPPDKSRLAYIKLSDDIYLIGSLLLQRVSDEWGQSFVNIFQWRQPTLKPRSRDSPVENSAERESSSTLHKLNLIAIRRQISLEESLSIIKSYHQYHRDYCWILANMKWRSSFISSKQLYFIQKMCTQFQVEIPEKYFRGKKKGFGANFCTKMQFLAAHQPDNLAFEEIIKDLR